MIEILEDLPPGVLGFRPVGTVTAEDYRNVLDPALDATISQYGKADLVLVIDDEFDRYTIGAILEDAKLLRRPLALWDRAAFVTDRDVLTGIAVAFGGLVPGVADSRWMGYVRMPAALGEIGSCLWLLAFGARAGAAKSSAS